MIAVLLLALAHGAPKDDPVVELRRSKVATEVRFAGLEFAESPCARFTGAGNAVGKEREALRKCLLQQLEQAHYRTGASGPSGTQREYEGADSMWSVRFSHLDRGPHGRAPKPSEETFESVTRWSISGARKTIASQLLQELVVDPPSSNTERATVSICLAASGKLSSCSVNPEEGSAQEVVRAALAAACSFSRSWTPHREGGTEVECCASIIVGLRSRPAPP